MPLYFSKTVLKSAILSLTVVLAPIGGYAQSAPAPQENTLARVLAAANAPALVLYYQSTGYALVFTNRPARLSALQAALETAGGQGLPVPTDTIEALRTAIASAGTPATDAALELLATRAYLKFATALSSGVLNPDDTSPLINFNTVRPAVPALLARAATSTGDGTLYETLEPQDPSYNALQAELARLEAQVQAGGRGPKIASGRALRPGQSGARVQAVRVRLNALGYTEIASQPDVYDDALLAAVKAFQGDNSLNADGIIGPKTLTALNSDPSVQMQQVIVNLERRRWLNRPYAARYILVNQASFMGYVIDNGTVTLATRVVVGKSSPKYQTPEFIDEMTHLVINPSWNVPRSIAAQEYLPQILRDPGVLARQNIVMVARNGQRVDPRLLDMAQFSPSNFPFSLRQVPGRGNALGKVKFMFPNRYNIYLHDTPAKNLFNRDTRAYSHGCVRVQRPLDLAYTLLAPQESDPQAVFQAYLAGGREVSVNLETPVPIYLTYQTVFLDKNGDIAYRVDVYGRDRVVFDALAENGVTLPGVQS